MNDRDDELYKQMVSVNTDTDEPSDELRERVLKTSLEALASSTASADVGAGMPSGVRSEVYRAAIRQGRFVRYGAVAAALAIVVLGGLAGWFPFGGKHRASDDWWLGPPAAWGQELGEALARIKGVTCREQTIVVTPDGSRHASSTVRLLYVSRDSYRRDIYDENELREVQWYTPDGDGMLQTSVRFDLESYCVLRHEGSFGQQDPVERLRFFVKLVDRADRVFDTETIEGRECVGFELPASRYGDNPDGWLDRIWFDTETRLPVRIEQERSALPGDERQETVIVIQDQFNWDPMLPADAFTPDIPQGFVEGHSDDLPPQED